MNSVKMLEISYQTASDVVRDGLGCELVDKNGRVLAEVFRCDKDFTVTLSTFGNDIKLAAIKDLLAEAQRRLGDFEDGTKVNW